MVKWLLFFHRLLCKSLCCISLRYLSVSLSLQLPQPVLTRRLLTRFDSVNRSLLSTAPKLPRELRKVLIDSPEFFSMMTESNQSDGFDDGVTDVKINQTDSAAILHSSGTTGRVKGVLPTHRNFVAANAGVHGFQLMVNSEETGRHPVFLCLLPLFHVFGFVMLIRAISRGDTVVLMQRFDFEGMLGAVEKYMVTYIPVTPPLVVALAKSELVTKYDLSSLRSLGCGGAPLGKEVTEKFVKFPNVEIFRDMA